MTGSANQALAEQFTGYPRALGMTAGVMAIMAILPGMPAIPFLALAGGMGYLAYSSRGKIDKKKQPMIWQSKLRKTLKQIPKPKSRRSPTLENGRAEAGVRLWLVVHGERR